MIEDDGRGFDAAAATTSGLGLVGMRERVGLLGGRLAIESSGGLGHDDRGRGAAAMTKKSASAS